MKLIGIVLILVSVFFILICLLKKTESFFNLYGIIMSHLKLFSDCRFQYIVFYIFPIVTAVGLAILYEAGETFYSELSVIISILLSMLFAVLSILVTQEYYLDTRDKDVQSATEITKQNIRIIQVVRETVNAIIFDSLLCLFMLLYNLIMIIIDGIQVDYGIIKSIFSGVAYYVFIVILLNLLLVLKRISKIVEYNLIINKNRK